MKEAVVILATASFNNASYEGLGNMNGASFTFFRQVLRQFLLKAGLWDHQCDGGKCVNGSDPDPDFECPQKQVKMES